jgi:molecular chaperone DnaK (HSP70)
MIENAKRYHAEDTKFLRMAKVSNELEDCVYNMKKFLKRKDVSSMISLKESEKINNAIIVATNLLYMNIKEKKINVHKSQLKELEKMLKHLKVKAGIEKKQKFSFLRSLFM